MGTCQAVGETSLKNSDKLTYGSNVVAAQRTEINDFINEIFDV